MIETERLIEKQLIASAARIHGGDPERINTMFQVVRSLREALPTAVCLSPKYYHAGVVAAYDKLVAVVDNPRDWARRA